MTVPNLVRLEQLLSRNSAQNPNQPTFRGLRQSMFAFIPGVEQTTSTLGSPLRGTLGEAHGSY